MRRALHVLYCDDGKGQVWNIKDCIERKVLQQLLSRWLPGLDIVEIQFSFHNENAFELLQKADIFYFKGFGGGTQQLLPIFGQSVSLEMAERIHAFQNKLMFKNMLAFLVCGAAILTGTHYPGENRLQGLKLLGDAHVCYHACQSQSIVLHAIKESFESDDKHVIHLAPGIANIIRCVGGDMQVHCEVVARDSPSHYWDLAAANTEHIVLI